MFEVWSHPLPDLGLTLRGWHTPPTGKPLIHFLHGNGFCGRTYEPMLRHLAQDFDLWLSDIQGHGDSDPGDAFLGWNRNAELAMQAFKAHHHHYPNAPHFAVGHSFGGVLTSLMLADRQHPFEKAVLLDPVLFSPTMLLGMSVVSLVGVGKLTPLAKSALKRRRHWPSRDAAFESLWGRGTYKGWTTEALRAFVDHALRDTAEGGVELKCAPSREADIFSSAPERLWGSIGRIRVPTLILHGQDTMPFVGPSAMQAASINDHITAQRVPGGHCFMQEDPAQAAARIREFLIGPA
ncbi:MAG: alpha/beta hydrolase [Burkholderiales bacterium]|nr:alpha/beta hydrolase [Burkholderiales bacterium]MDE2076943.1 alpha/beta hydrolase [Burkholderiales bacterium]MDE2433368.1 alpha/beta hydrolase [Burkholderiales bacterium]